MGGDHDWTVDAAHCPQCRADRVSDKATPAKSDPTIADLVAVLRATAFLREVR